MGAKSLEVLQNFVAKKDFIEIEAFVSDPLNKLVCFFYKTGDLNSGKLVRI